MAGKIALGILGLVLFGAFCFAAGYFRQREELLTFKVARVVPEGDTEGVTLNGMTAPFTVLVHEQRPVKVILPGELGQLGEEIALPDPRQNSESTTFP